ncbi:lytic transglycosylase domain-containing protein [Serratia proteamaculans]|uniref:lytic transglycosylase domain-containing protein n=1 Tax=Serratia proteamaculans TaxID=28151 RepID=UPI003CFF1481
MALAASVVMSLALQCAPSIHPQTMTTISKTESGFNPWAIGVVDRVLPKQPQSLEEALAVVKTLVAEGANFSVGLGQINRYNFDITKPELAFDPCNNLRMAASILESCYERYDAKGVPKQTTLLKAISCYYSGNPKRGFEPEPQFGGTSHVQRVLANAETLKVPAIGADESFESPESEEPVQRAAPRPPPTYESWDVLRQYPRYNAAPPASQVPAKPNPETEAFPQESTDA